MMFCHRETVGGANRSEQIMNPSQSKEAELTVSFFGYGPLSDLRG